jgi:hypothetical protein
MKYYVYEKHIQKVLNANSHEEAIFITFKEAFKNSNGPLVISNEIIVSQVGFSGNEYRKNKNEDAIYYKDDMYFITQDTLTKLGIAKRKNDTNFDDINDCNNCDDCEEKDLDDDMDNN